MSNPDRNAYEPSYEEEDIDNFDATDEEEEESSGRSPVLIILGLLVLAGFGAVVWMAYEQGKRQSVRTETPTLLADQSPTKVAPDNPGGTNAAGGDPKLVYDQVTGTRTQTAEQLLPPAETPATRPETPVTTTPTTNLGSPSRPTGTTTGSTTTATGPRTTDSTTSGGSLRPTTTADAGNTATDPTTTSRTASTTAPTTTTGTRPTTTTAPTTTAPTTAGSTTEPTTTAPTTTTQAKPTTTGDQVATITQVDPTVVPPATVRSAGSGSYVVQVGSYPNDAAAASAWQSIKGKNTSLLASYKPDVVPADLGAKGKWYRLRVGPFDLKDTASDLCTKLQANGQACLVAKP